MPQAAPTASVRSAFTLTREVGEREAGTNVDRSLLPACPPLLPARLPACPPHSVACPPLCPLALNLTCACQRSACSSLLTLPLSLAVLAAPHSLLPGDNIYSQLGVGSEPALSGVPLAVPTDKVYSSIHAVPFGSAMCGIINEPGSPDDKTLECWCACYACCACCTCCATPRRAGSFAVLWCTVLCRAVLCQACLRPSWPALPCQQHHARLACTRAHLLSALNPPRPHNHTCEEGIPACACMHLPHRSLHIAWPAACRGVSDDRLLLNSTTPEPYLPDYKWKTLSPGLCESAAQHEVRAVPCCVVPSCAVLRCAMLCRAVLRHAVRCLHATWQGLHPVQRGSSPPCPPARSTTSCARHAFDLLPCVQRTCAASRTAPTASCAGVRAGRPGLLLGCCRSVA